MLIAVLNLVRYNNPTPNPLPAIREGALDVPDMIRKRYRLKIAWVEISGEVYLRRF
jgi:hypothetical protein